MGTLISSLGCMLMIVVFAAIFLGAGARRRNDAGEESSQELQQLRRDVAELRQERAEREPR